MSLRLSIQDSLNKYCTVIFHSEKLFKDMADRMAADGYKEAGYQYVNIDVSVCFST